MAGLLSTSLWLITYLVGTVKPHHACTYTRTRTHRHTLSLQHAEPGRALFHPSFFSPQQVIGAGCLCAPATTNLTIFNSTNKQTNAKTHNQEWHKTVDLREKDRSPAMRSSAKVNGGSDNWHSMHPKCERSNTAYWRQYMVT